MECAILACDTREPVEDGKISFHCSLKTPCSLCSEYRILSELSREKSLKVPYLLQEQPVPLMLVVNGLGC
jgi:hypothetical protein